MEKLTEQQRIELFKSIATDKTGRAVHEYITSRAAVIEPLIQKESQIRQILEVQDFTTASGPPTYSMGGKEVQTAWVAPAVGTAPRRQIEGDEITIPYFVINGGVEWLMDLAKDARFDVAAESQFYLKEQIIEMENLVGWTLIKNAAADSSFPANNSVQIGSGSGIDMSTGQGFFSPQLFAELQLAADKARRRITDIYVSPTTMFDIFNYWGLSIRGYGGNTSTYTSTVPDGVAEKIFNAGTPGSGDQDGEFIYPLMGIKIHKVYNSSVVGDGTVYAFDLSKRRSTFGVMPLRDRLETWADPIAIMQHKVGMFCRERLGMGILDINNLFVGTISRS